MNLFKKVYKLLLVIVACVIVFQVENTGLSFGAFINRFSPCVQNYDTSFPCYAGYDIGVMALAFAVGLILVGIVIFILIKNFREKHIEYWKDNPHGYWFKRKIYGWGWFPVKWQGWFTIATFIIYILLSSLDMKSDSGPTDIEITWFIFKVILSIIILTIICYKKGEKPKWQWGIENPKK